MATVDRKVGNYTGSSKWHRRMFSFQVFTPSIEETLNLVVQVPFVGWAYTLE